MAPVITVVTTVLILHKIITWMAGVSMALTLAGLFLSESKLVKKRQNGGLRNDMKS